MKLGNDFEGSPEELANLCKNHGFNPDRFLKKQHDIPMWPLVVFFGLFVAFCIIIIFLESSAKIELTLAILALVAFIIGLIAAHLKYERKDVLIAIIIAGIAILALSYGQMDFRDVVEKSLDAIK